MNLRDLRYIVAVAELGQFGRAATACNVSQPTLSGQILKLEEELGVQIFERDGRVARVTERGEAIVAHARRVVGAADDLKSAAAAARDPLEGPIRLGIIATVGPYLAPFLLPAAARDLPQAPIRLVEDLTGHLLPLLADGKLDAAIIATDPPTDPSPDAVRASKVIAAEARAPDPPTAESVTASSVTAEAPETNRVPAAVTVRAARLCEPLP